MPKSLSDNERSFIRKRLLEEAEVCLNQYGLRKTTVDELVKRVHIPKGTFYLFYASKELLFYDVLVAFHDEIQRELLDQLRNMQDSATPLLITEVIFGFYKKIDSSFLYRLITDGELELLMQKLPPETVKEHLGKDNLSIERLLSLLPGMKKIDTEVFSGALRGVFFTMLHKREIGEDIFDNVLRLMIYSVIQQLYREGCV